MGIKKTLGGDRLGSGGRMTVEMHNFGRSSHNIGCIVRTDQAFGTIVPYFCDIATNGTTYTIDIATKTRTLPTNGPIFGTAKHQIDVFATPIRLYIAALHNNALGIGLKMENIKLPVISLKVQPFTMEDLKGEKNLNATQISQDSLLAYLGIRGLGQANAATTRKFPAIFLLNYWDIYKNYYANKQEEKGVVISGMSITAWDMVTLSAGPGTTTIAVTPTQNRLPNNTPYNIGKNTIITVFLPKGDKDNYRKVMINTINQGWVTISENPYVTVKEIENDSENQQTFQYRFENAPDSFTMGLKPNPNPLIYYDKELINLIDFPLETIDEMRESILAAPKTRPFDLTTAGNDVGPYRHVWKEIETGPEKTGIGAYYSQAGLGLRTYLSDRFNNWLSTEWIDGVNGINEITAVDVSDGKLSMDSFILAKKIFNMLNRIAVSGGSYNDWQEAVYGVRTIQMDESPIYCGGFSSEIVFDEVVSNSATEDEPLGSLAGRGSDRNSKGGNSIKVKIKEPSMLMILGSIVPRVDYSQGNAWWNELETMNDLHKPNLDAIGFQELVTEEFAAWDTIVEANGSTTTKSVGKQPSWIQYMTNTNKTFGSFSAGGPLEFMAFNRKYHHTSNEANLEDATTYIDPTIYNTAFADAKITAKNIWVQVAFDITARRVMSAKQIPNL